MRVELLPSSVPSGSGPAAPQFLSSYLIGESLVIDGGSVGLLADVARQLADLFNGRTWPDFLALSTPDNAFMRATLIKPLETVERAGCRVTPVPVTHSGDTLGMIVDDGRSCVAFAADTGPTDLLWEELASRPTLTAVFLECSFPNAMEDLATKTGHLCPHSFATQRARLPAHVRVLAVHRKARYADMIARELAALDLPNVEPVTPGPPTTCSAYDL
jgi:hypothetical protein